MNKNRFRAMTVAGILVASSLFGTTAMATNQTTVTLNVVKGNTYTLTVPADVTVEASGYTKTTGIKVTSDNDMSSKKKVVVTASSANDWNLKSGEKSVAYAFTASESETDTTTSFDFEGNDINAEGGKTQDAWVYVTADDYKTAEEGVEYSDVITFNAEVKNLAVFEKADASTFDWDNIKSLSPLEARTLKEEMKGMGLTDFYLLYRLNGMVFREYCDTNLSQSITKEKLEAVIDEASYYYVPIK